MYRLKLIVIISLVCFYSCQVDNNQTIIIGKIVGTLNKSLEYSSSENGGCFWAFPNEINVDSLGNFKIELDIENAIFIQSLVGSYDYGKFVVEPGETYQLVIDLENESILVWDKNNKGQDLYRKLSNEQVLNVALRHRDDSLLSESINEILSSKIDEIKQFDEAYSKGEISKSYYDLIIADRNCYYSAIAANTVLLQSWRNDIDSAYVKKAWSTIFEETSIFSPNISNSFWYYSYLENYLEFQYYLDSSINYDRIKELTDQGTIHTFIYDLARKHLSGIALEYYAARYIYSSCIPLKYETDLVNAFELFKLDFPNSSFIQYLEPMITSITDFHRYDDQTYPEGITLLENYQQIDSFDECMNHFKGKKVFVDIWATWCLPCRAAFKYKDELKKVLQSKGYEMLYISIDVDRYGNKWHEVIKYYNLEGFHVKASEKLTSDIQRLFGDTVPRYLIIDNEGKIINSNAKSPSLIKELNKQLK